MAFLTGSPRHTGTLGTQQRLQSRSGLGRSAWAVLPGQRLEPLFKGLVISTKQAGRCDNDIVRASKTP